MSSQRPRLVRVPMTPGERVSARQVRRAGASPFGRAPLADLDTSQAVICRADGCGRRFLNESFLAAHGEMHSAPPPSRKASAAE